MILGIFFCENILAQVVEKEYTSLNDALKNPDAVTRLNLSNQTLEQNFEFLTKFKNLKYLNL